MRISRVRVANFRNFKLLDAELGPQAVFVGENGVGKSNLIFALRLVLDPSLPDTARQLRLDDFWDGLPRPLGKEDRIVVSVELADFEERPEHLALLAEHLIQAEPMVARLTYVFQPLPSLEKAPSSEADYEFLVYGGERQENVIDYQVRRRLPVEVLPALRDAEGDLANQRRSPLRPLLDRAAANLDWAKLKDIAASVQSATTAVAEVPEIKAVADELTSLLTALVGSSQATTTSLGFSPTDPDDLLRALRLFVEGGRRSIPEASLGSANLLYLALRILELEQEVKARKRDYTFIAIEEPEAHLHPQLQRRVYRSLLGPRAHQPDAKRPAALESTSVLLTTHSPHIVSVSPLRSLVLLRREKDYTEGYSAATLALADPEIADLERYLDVTRGEMVFARGVLLVEGDAELYLVPCLGYHLGIDLDELGITVCSVSGTHFTSYARFLTQLGTPFAVMTDRDPQPGGDSLAQQRVANLMRVLGKDKIADDAEVLTKAAAHGVFVNTDTFELELLRQGLHAEMCRAIEELSDNGAARKRAHAGATQPGKIDHAQLMKDIGEIGKGRFAQRLATIIGRGARRPEAVPDYIEGAIQHVVSLCP